MSVWRDFRRGFSMGLGFMAGAVTGVFLALVFVLILFKFGGSP